MRYTVISSDELYHHGILGMKWGVWNEATRARRLGSTKLQNKLKDAKNNDEKIKILKKEENKNAAIIGVGMLSWIAGIAGGVALSTPVTMIPAGAITAGAFILGMSKENKLDKAAKSAGISENEYKSNSNDRRSMLMQQQINNQIFEQQVRTVNQINAQQRIIDEQIMQQNINQINLDNLNMMNQMNQINQINQMHMNHMFY